MSQFGVNSSGVLAVGSTAVKAAPARIHGVTLLPGTAASTIIVYDNASAASGTVLAKLNGAANDSSITLHLDCPIEANNGIYAVVAGTAAEAVVHFSIT